MYGFLNLFIIWRGETVAQAGLLLINIMTQVTILYYINGDVCTLHISIKDTLVIIITVIGTIKGKTVSIIRYNLSIYRPSLPQTTKVQIRSSKKTKRSIANNIAAYHISEAMQNSFGYVFIKRRECLSQTQNTTFANIYILTVAQT